MSEAETLELFKAEARDALETYLDALTLPSLQGFAPTELLELTLHASLKTIGPLPAQTLELSVTPFHALTETNLLTSGSTPQEPGVRSLEDLARSDQFLQS